MAAVKDRVLAVLYGAAPAIDLSADDIQYVRENLPESVGSVVNKSEKVDFSSVRFNHKSSSFNEALGFDTKEEKTLERKVEDALEDHDSRSLALEFLLRSLGPKEIVWLVDSGMAHTMESKMKEAMMRMMGIMKKKKRGNQGDTPSGPDFTSEE